MQTTLNLKIKENWKEHYRYSGEFGELLRKEDKRNSLNDYLDFNTMWSPKHLNTNDVDKTFKWIRTKLRFKLQNIDDWSIKYMISSRNYKELWNILISKDYDTCLQHDIPMVLLAFMWDTFKSSRYGSVRINAYVFSTNSLRMENYVTLDINYGDGLQELVNYIRKVEFFYNHGLVLPKYLFNMTFVPDKNAEPVALYRRFNYIRMGNTDLYTALPMIE